jgi:hypothetical protein
LRQKRCGSYQRTRAGEECEEQQPVKNFHAGSFARSAEFRLDNQFEII